MLYNYIEVIYVNNILFRKVIIMFCDEKKSNVSLPYERPEIIIIHLTEDIITASHHDPNMGEWDTDF